MPATQKRNPLYHSALLELGRTTLRFKGDIRDGKYGPYCFVQLKGEEDDRLFSVDSDMVREEVERTRRTVKDGWVEVEAAGAKDGAVLRVIMPGTDGPTFPGDSQQNGPPPKEWGNESKPVASEGGVVDTAVAMTVRAVQRLKEAGIPIDSDAAARVYSTHFIQSARG